MRTINNLALMLILAGLAVPAHAQFAQQGAKLVGTGNAGSAQQGCSVAVSADGNTVLIGGNADNNGGAQSIGAAWVFTRNGGVWTQQGGKLVGTGGIGFPAQGSSVSLSADGNTALISGYGDNDFIGATWVFTRNGGVWTQQGGKLVGTGGTGASQQGESVALSSDGNTALIGGPADNSSIGATWVFTRSGGVWTQQGSKLVGTAVGGSFSFQGVSVSLSADSNTALIGGYSDSGGIGAAWVFTRSGGVWTQQGGKLVGTGAIGFAYQGQSVSLSADGNTALVGGFADNNEVGATWVFTRSAGVWTQQGSKLVGAGGVGSSWQGTSVSLSASGDTALIGGQRDDSDTGAAWVFTEGGGVWTQLGNKLVGTGAAGAAFQAVSIAISADASTAVLGGHYDNFDSGASWVFAVPVTVSPSSLPSATLNQPGYSQTITASGGSAPLTLSHTGTFPPGMMFDDATGILNGTPTALGTYTFTVTATDSGGATGSTTYTLPVIQAAPGTFTTVASMTTARAYQTATLLSSGKVLVAGGYNGTYLQSAEVYDSASNTWTAAGSLITARGYHTSTLLPSGKVLVVGGYNSKSGALSSAEVYDPVSNTWSAAGTLATGRDSHTATLLPSGKVLVAGGFNGTSFLNLSSAEVYDPASNTWSAAGTLSDFRSYHTATLLPSGKVLVAGGQGNSGKLSSVDVYDPASSSWSAAGTLSTTRGYHTATLMPSGKVLVAGGQSNSGNLSSAEVYDPAINTWSTTGSLSTARLDHTATLLPNGKVLVAGGFNSGYLSSAEVYDPATNTWSAAGSLNAARHNQTATLLPSGKVLVVGGISTSGLPVSSAELYDSASNTWTATATLTTGRDAHTATLLSSGKVLVAGGFNDNLGDLNNAELFDPTAKVWTATGSFNTPRELHTATLLSNGKVLIAGGTDGNAVLSTAEIYDPASGTWAAAGNVGTRYTHTATLLPSGKVLVTGGIDGNNVLDSAMLYDPGGNSWTPAANLSVPRFYHSATLLPSGRVLVAGGKSNFGIQNTAEIYDPVANTWTATGNLLSVRAYQTATLLPSGKVLIAAGRDASNAVGTAEIFDPGTNTWSSAGSLSAGRYQHTATLLASGRVLIAGGWTGASVTNGAEIYDPATNAWSAAGNLLTPRILHTTTLLTSGQVIVAGGNYGTALSSTELTDDGLQYQSAWRPTIASATSPLTVQTPMSLTGTLFTGISEASGGATNNSPSNNPFVVLQSLANEQVRYLRPDPANPWTASSYSSLPVAPLNPGYALLTVIVNGIPSQSSIIQINNPAGVTPVRLDSFAARTEGTGVLLSWNAISEFQNAGFNVYRRSLSAPQDEPRPQGSGHDWTRVNAALIAGRATNPDSKTYRLYDWAPPGAYQYKLESVSLDGVRESYTELAGPVELDWRETNSRSISDDGDGAAQASIAAEAQERRGQKNSAKFAALAATATARERQDRTQMLATVRAIPYCRAEMPGDGSAAVSSAATQPIATLNANAAARWFSQTSPNRTASFNAVKVVYDTPGVLRVPQSSLPVGFDIRHVSIQREGRSVTALAVTNDSLILFGPGYQDDYTDKDAFFLRAIPGNTAAGRLSSATGLFASAQPVYAESPASVTASYHDVYYDYNYRPYDFPPWFSGQYLTQGTDQTFSIDTPLANGSAASLVVNVWSLTQSETATPDHALQVLVNGQPVGQTQWSGGGKMMQLSFEIAASVLVNGANQIDLVTPALDGVDSQISFLHSMTVNYTRALDTSKPVGVVNASAATKLFELTSASANAWIVDTRYPDRAALVPYESQAQADGTFKLRFTAASGGTGHYLVVPVGQENQPLAVSKRQIKPVPSNNQYLAVGPTQFSAGIQPLLARRSKEGIRTSFVDQEQVFDYYGFGRYGPAAIQAAVRATRPKYLLLLGRTTYDYRNYSGANVDPLCPAFLVSTSNWAQTTSDSMFGDLGRGYPEVAVGRLPVNDTGDLNGAVNHILSYKGIASSNIKVHAVADRTDPSAGDFGALLDSVSSAHPELAWQRNYLGTTSNDPADITAALNTAANGAADVLLYSGHGNALRLGKDDPRILDTEKVQLWTGHTIFLQATCTANWMAKDESDYKSIAIQALTQPQGGISASIASSTYVTADAHVEFMNQLLKNANASGTRWGDALLKTQQWSFQKGTTPGIYGDLGKSEQLFGEPALPVFAPIPAPTLNSQPGKF